MKGRAPILTPLVIVTIILLSAMAKAQGYPPGMISYGIEADKDATVSGAAESTCGHKK